MELYSKDNLVSVSNSILKHFNLPMFHTSLDHLDECLNKSNNKKIALVLLDGYGSHIQEIYKNETRFIYDNVKVKITSIFPPTTVAATSSLLTGKYPCETGYLGWFTKLPFYQTPVTTFSSKFVDSQEESKITTSEYLPKEEIIDILNKNNIKADKLMGFNILSHSFIEFCELANKMLKNNMFSYLYWPQPDGLLHEYGTKSEIVAKCLKEIDINLKQLIENNKDTIFIVLADHGHIDLEFVSIKEHEDLYSMLESPFVNIEGRANAFFVKKECVDEFGKLLKSYYSNDEFYILSKKEVIDNKVFGLGKNCPQFEELIGDYLIISKGHKIFYDDYTAFLKSGHAGASKDELDVNVSIFNY